MGLRYRDGKKGIALGWDATDGRNGGAERTVWETLLEMVRIVIRAPASDHVGAGPGKGVWAGQSPSCLGSGDVLQFPKEDFACVVRLLLSTTGGHSLKGASRDRSRPSRPSSLNRLRELMMVYPTMKLRVSVDDITAFMESWNKALPGIAERVLRAMRRVCRREGWEEQGDGVTQLLG